MQMRYNILIYFSFNEKQSCWNPLVNQPILSNEGKVSCSKKQREPLMVLELTTDRHPPIPSQTS